MEHPRVRQCRWAGLLASSLTYATAAYFSYVATFVYVSSTPYRPNGPYGDRYCAQPHLIFGQICRVWTERGLSTSSRVGLGVLLVAAFLLVALVARRFVATFLLIPLLLLPFVRTEPHVWLASAVVALVAVAAISGLQLWARATPAPRMSWLPLGALAVAVAGAAVLSVLSIGWTPDVPILPVNASGSAGQVRTWSSVELFQISCPSKGECVATGDRPRGGGSQSAAVRLNDGGWGAPITLTGMAALEGNPLDRVACASGGSCLSTGLQNATTLAIATDHDGRWGGHTLSIPDSFGLISDAIACSTGGTCWVIVDQITRGSDSHTWSYAVGNRDGRWRQPYRIGGPGLRVAGQPAAFVIARDMSCWSASSCTVLARAASRHGRSLAAFLQTETNGHWGPPSMLPTTAGDGFGAYLSFGEDTLLSCTSADDCIVGGSEGPGQDHGAVEQEVDGRWLAPVAVGITGPKMSSSVLAVTCRARDLCVAAGATYPHGYGHPAVAFAQAEVRGRWRRPSLMGFPGFSSDFLAKGIACTSSSSCVFVGNFGFSTRSASFVARYEGSGWSWSIASVDGQWRNLWLFGLSCVKRTCWVSGTLYGAKGAPTGVVAPVS